MTRFNHAGSMTLVRGIAAPNYNGPLTSAAATVMAGQGQPDLTT
jgi:hypothetical protein